MEEVGEFCIYELADARAVRPYCIGEWMYELSVFVFLLADARAVRPYIIGERL